MKKSGFAKRVIAEMPNLANIGTYFYVRPVTHILSGFCCEMTPRGAYLWNFLYPLFDPSDSLHLTYSARFEYPDDYVDFSKVGKKELPRIFVERIKSRMDRAVEFLSVQSFCSYCEGRPGLTAKRTH